ncbi:unnamed protein product, partial [Didymodactylos carnosus]
MPAALDEDEELEPFEYGDTSNGYNADFFDASVAELAELLKETEDDFTVSLQDTLSNIFSNQAIFNLAYSHDILLRFIQQPEMMKPVSSDNLSLITSVMKDLEIVGMTNLDARELETILRNPHMRVIMDAHQSIATREYAEEQLPIGYLPEPVPDISAPPFVYPGIYAAKMIGIESTGEEHLGITVKLNETGDLEIKRIVQGGLIDKQ